MEVLPSAARGPGWAARSGILDQRCRACNGWQADTARVGGTGLPHGWEPPYPDRLPSRTRLGHPQTGGGELSRAFATPNPICPSCWAHLVRGTITTSACAFPVWSLTAYVQQWRRLVIALKHDPRLDAARIWQAIGSAAGVSLALAVTTRVANLPSGPLFLSVAPSSWRRFGNAGTAAFATGIAQSWQYHLIAPQVTVARRLWLHPGARSQAGASGRQRREGRHGTMAWLGWGPAPARGRHILVDDVTTTGATLTEMARAIGAAGGRVVGAITFSAVVKTPNRV